MESSHEHKLRKSACQKRKLLTSVFQNFLAPSSKFLQLVLLYNLNKEREVFSGAALKRRITIKKGKIDLLVKQKHKQSGLDFVRKKINEIRQEYKLMGKIILLLSPNPPQTAPPTPPHTPCAARAIKRASIKISPLRSRSSPKRLPTPTSPFHLSPAPCSSAGRLRARRAGAGPPQRPSRCPLPAFPPSFPHRSP